MNWIATLAAVVVLAWPAAGARPAWPQWLGPHRNGHADALPTRLPARPRFIWKRPLTGMGLSGVAATPQFVIVADKSANERDDIWRCLDTDTGAPLWTLRYPAPGYMDPCNAPRAAPLLHDGLAYLQGAFGHLHCVRLATGEVVWKRNVFKDFGSKPLPWGMCVSPLLADGKLIVAPGAKDAALVALNPRTGEVVWKTPGRPSAYASFIVGEFGGVRQIVGYDAVSLGGWDLAAGRRLWELKPPVEGDFNVPTPIDAGGRLLVATENNGTRLYGFDSHGRIISKPLASNDDLAPDTATPVVCNGLVFGCSGMLLCLDLRRGLKTLWSAAVGRAFDDHAALIAGQGRVLAMCASGDLLLIAADPKRCRVLSRLKLFEDTEVWSYPALLGDRLFVRSQDAVYCVSLKE